MIANENFMKGTVILIMMTVVGFGIACGHHPKPTYSDYQTSQPQSVTHIYTLYIVDADDNPLECVRIDYEFYDRETGYQAKSFVTKSDGKLVQGIQAGPDPRFTYEKSIETKLNYKISKEGYHSISGSMTLRSESFESESKKISLIRPIDYFSPSFLYSDQGIELKTRILAFIDLIRLHSSIGNSYLETKSIALVEFKNNKYLQLKFNTVTTFNSLKMNKYDIGKRLFDEIVRKVLNPLNQYISDPRIFFGYDLNITGYTKSFAAEYASPQSIKYRFLIPDETVKKYKTKDISGQQVLDDSIILMDDDRIELKLQ